MTEEFQASRVWDDIATNLPEYIRESQREIQGLRNILNTAYTEGELSVEVERSSEAVDGDRYEDERGYECIIIEDWGETNDDIKSETHPHTTVVLSTSTASCELTYRDNVVSTLGSQESRKEFREDSRWRTFLARIEDDIKVAYDRQKDDPYFR